MEKDKRICRCIDRRIQTLLPCIVQRETLLKVGSRDGKVSYHQMRKPACATAHHAHDSIVLHLAEMLDFGGELMRLNQIGHGVVRPLTIKDWQQFVATT